ncbi:MAG: CHAT domain-containing tetratricopeptide repeat protein [Bacteroidota bacterium]
MRLLWIVLPFVMICHTTMAQNLFTQYKQARKSETFDAFYEAAKDSVEAYYSLNNWQKGHDAMNMIARVPFDETRLKLFEGFVQKQIASYQSVNAVESAYMHVFVGKYLVQNEYFKEAITHYKRAADKLYALNDTKHLHYVYYWLGQTCQFGLADGAQALVYADQAERIFNLRKEKEDSFKAKPYYLRGVAYRSSDLEKSILNLRKSQKLGKNDPDMERLIAMSLFDLKRYDEALTAIRKASQLYITTYEEPISAYNVYEARILEKLGQHELALEKSEKALDYCKKYFKYVGVPELSKVLYYQARIYRNMALYDNALKNCQKIFESNYPDFKSSSLTSIPDITDGTHNHWVLNTILELGRILVFKFQQTQNSELLASALEIYKQGIADIQLRRKNMANWDSKEQYNEFLYKAYEEALEASVRMYQIDNSIHNRHQVLYFLEKSKSTILHDKLQSKTSSKNIPEEILTKEKALTQSITEIETTLLQNQSENNDAEVKELKNKLFDAKKVLEDFKKEHVEYYTPNSSNENKVDPSEIMQNLPDKTLVLAYHLSEDNIIEVGFNTTDLHVQISSQQKDFEGALKNMRLSLSSWNQILTNRESSNEIISQLTAHLGTILFQTLGKFSNTSDQIIIMPNGSLNNIPFELLMHPGLERMMIQDYDISYAYLFSSLPKVGQVPQKKLTFAGFAPKYSNGTEEQKESRAETEEWLALRAGLIDIPEARKNVKTLARRYHGVSWINEEATKTAFRDQAKNFDVLHLGMHSLLDEQTAGLSSLVFSGESDHKLFLHEVQSMDIPAELVVLSACNTGVGRHVLGEGSLSLARAFFFAGAKSTLMSLWQVPDQQTSRIMQLFYKNLDQGMNKSKALAKAKRDYLKKASVLESHPSFWSGFVLVGDDSPLKLTISYGRYLIYLAVFIVLCGLFLWRKKTFSKNQ